MIVLRSVASLRGQIPPDGSGVLDRPAPTWRVAQFVRSPATWLVGVSTVIRAGIGIQVPAPSVLPDELVYSELAKAIASGHRPAIRGVPVFGWGEVYPTIVAPAWALFHDPLHAYHFALVINALVMSSAAVPAYFLAGLFVSRRASSLVAAMAVLIPSMGYTGLVMTENVFYPAFLLGIYLIARAVRRPTAGNQALALLGLGGLVFTRIQGFALVGAYLGAVALYAVTGSTPRHAYLRRFAPTVVVALSATLAPFVLSAAVGDGAFGWLGTRSGTFAAFHALEVPEWFTYLTADLVLYVAVVPACATVVVLGRGLSRYPPEPVRLFAAVALPTLLAVLVSVSLVSASLDVDGTENLNERYVFYVVPLLFVGLALWIREGLPRSRPWSRAIVAVCCVLTVALPIDRLHYNSGFQSIALIPWIVSSLSGVVLASVVGVFTLACGALWLTCRRERVGTLWALVGVWMAFVGLLAVGSNLVWASDSATHSFGPGTETWVDDAVPRGTAVTVVWDQRAVSNSRPDDLYFRVMVAEFFNRSVGDVLRIGPQTYYEVFLPTIRVGPGRGDSALVDRRGRQVQAEYVLASCRTPVVGDVVAREPRAQLSVVRVHGSVRLSGARGCSARNDDSIPSRVDTRGSRHR